MKNILLLVTLALSGCSSVANYSEISSSADLAYIVGTKFVSTVEFSLTGFNSPPGYGSEVDFYEIGPSSSSSVGPEVITRTVLPKDARVKIVSIQQCTNCFTFGNPLRKAVVTIEGFPMKYDLEVTMLLDYYAPQYVEFVE